METIHTIVRNAEQGYLTQTTKLGKYVSMSMHDTIETIDAYLNSKHIKGKTDSLGREKPFFNIVTAAANIWYRATDIDRKDLRFIPEKPKSVVLSFIANILLQQWMDKTNFGQFLNQWGRALARYGSAVVKFIEKDGELIPVVVPWNRFIADPIDFDAIPHIEKFYLTPTQLRQKKEYDQDAVSSLITEVQARRTLDGQTQDDNGNFIEIYEVHGSMDSRLLQKDPDLTLDDGDITYVQQMHVVSFLLSGDEYKDFTLYKGREAHDPYMLTHLIKEDGRTLSIGAVEYLFEAQWMTNHSIKAMKDTIDLTSMLLMQTADPRFLGRNVISALETGDILVHQPNMPLEPVNNSKPDLTYVQNFTVMWRQLGQELTNTPDLTRGISQAQPLTYGLGQILNNNSNSLFEIMTENKGIDLEMMCKQHVVPNLKKKIKAMKADDILAMLDSAGVSEIDAYFVPLLAVEQYNTRSMKQIEDAFSQPLDQVNPDSLPTPFDMNSEKQSIEQQLAPLGNRRIFKTDELSKKTWDALLSDYEWDCLKLVVTNENSDQQAVLQTLSTALQTIATNPMVLQDPNGKMLFNKLLSQTGVVSPIELSLSRSPSSTPVPGG